MNTSYLFLVFLLILTFLVLSQPTTAANIINAAGGQITSQITALQGRGGSGYVGA